MTTRIIVLGMLVISCGSVAAEEGGSAPTPTGGAPSSTVSPPTGATPPGAPRQTVRLGANARLADLPAEGTHVAWVEGASPGTQVLKVLDLAAPSASSVAVRSWSRGFEDVHISPSGAYVSFASSDGAGDLVDLYVAPTHAPDLAWGVGRALLRNVASWPRRDALLFVAAAGLRDDARYASCEIHLYDLRTRTDSVLGVQPACDSYPSALADAFSADGSKLLFWALQADGRLHLNMYDIDARTMVRPRGDELSIPPSFYLEGNCRGCARFSTDRGFVSVATDTAIGSWIGWEGWPPRLTPAASGQRTKLSPGGTYGLLYEPGADTYGIVEPRSGGVRVVRGSVDDLEFAPGDRRAVLKLAPSAGAATQLAFMDLSTGATTQIGDASARLSEVSFSTLGTLGWRQVVGVRQMTLFRLDDANTPAAPVATLDSELGAQVALGQRPESLVLAASGMWGQLLVVDPKTGRTRPIAPILDTAYGRPNANGAYAAQVSRTPDSYRLVVQDHFDLTEGIGTLHPSRNLYVVDDAPGLAVRVLASVAPGRTLSYRAASNRYAVYGVVDVANYGSALSELFAVGLMP
ncbi:MAG: hypothetical protein HOO96_18960 [Polyangiaceae bacterium]|nr:hypothetical protein [Polyangiaceae bacterium]